MKILHTVFVSAITTLVVIAVLGVASPQLTFLNPARSVDTETVREELNRTEAAPTVINLETIPDVVEVAIPAVASIVISAEVPVVEQYYEEFWSPFGSLFGNDFGFTIPRQRQIGTERQEVGGGTGFFVSADGYLITNRHVVDQAGVNYTVVTNDGETHDVTVVAKDPTLDVAILKVEGAEPFPFLAFAEMDSVRLGEPVIAIGNALAEFPNSVSVGVVSGLSRDIVARGGRMAEALEGVIQTDAAINRGNSGGPLINTKGQVIGVNVAVAGGGENIGFALPSNLVSSVYQSVLEHGEIVRPFIGIRYLKINDEIAARNNLSVDYGVLIIRGETHGDLAVIPGSPADRAGLEENDIILEIEGTRLDEDTSLASLLRQYEVGDTITLTVLSDGEEETVRLTLVEAES